MITRNVILENRYYDSVVLMNAADKVKSRVGASQVSLMMGTDANKDLLRSTSLLTDEGETATPGDLIVALKIDREDLLADALKALEEALAPTAVREGEEYTPRSIEAACKLFPAANLALISIPGQHVEWEALKLLDKGIHLMIFSDNVPLETEIKLKKKGEKEGLLVMGPDCGTAIITGAALGFANKIRAGKIGIVAAAGTGIQEVSTIIHKFGGGVSHAIGTGGRDLSKQVGGITMKMGIKALAEDPETDVLILISKPPHPEVEKEMYSLVEEVEKPVVVNFLGSTGEEAKKRGINFSPTLEDAALKALKLYGIDASLPIPAGVHEKAQDEVVKLKYTQKYLRGLYSGGTLTNETRLILEDMGFKIWSNVTKDKDRKLEDPFKSNQHTLVDMGDDVFTRGAPHPMIDSTKRIARIIEEARDPSTAVILIDLVLGYGAHPDPAPEIAQAVREARVIAERDRRHLIFVASVCGVPEDPQNSKKQKRELEKAGVIVLPTNASAARFAGETIEKISH